MSKKPNNKTSKKPSQPQPKPIEPTPPPKPLEPGLNEKELTIEFLRSMGPRLDEKPAPYRLGHFSTSPEASTYREILMWRMLRIRDKHGHLRSLVLNRAQRDLETTSTDRNVVLKARQLGVTTYVASRFFINCITREGTLAVQVAHDQRSAEEIFRIVHRFLENLPKPLRQGALVTSRANVRQIVFPVLEGVFGSKSGATKKAAVLSFVQTAVSATDEVAGKTILDPNKFQDGLSKVIDGVVACLNASVWSTKH